MRVLVPVLVVAIIAITAYLIVRNMNRTADLRKNLSNALLEKNQLKSTLRQIESELSTQTLAGYFDPAPFQNILNDHEKDITAR